MYTEIAQVYDQLMKEDIDYNKWSDYIQSIFKRYHGSVNDVLDLGSGTGNVTIPLSKKGYRMVGVDRSEDMLAIADEKAFAQNQDIKWLHGDMVHFKMEKSFDAILSCCDCINYILKSEDLLSVFKNAHESLRESGLFLFDIHSPYRIREIYSRETYTYTSDELCYIWENTFDEESDIIEYDLSLFIKNHHNAYYTRSEEVHYERAYDIDEVKNLLKKAGFQRIDVFHFPTFRQPTEGDERIQFICV